MEKDNEHRGKDKTAAKEKNLTQEDLADYLHISSQAVSKWETGAARLENIENAESLCIDKLICMLWLRREEETDPETVAAIDAQAHAMLDLFKSYPIYSGIAESMEKIWNEGSIMRIYGWGSR